jgi:predicted nuclease of restriction endonuclease-like RecB superfamily
VPTVKKTKVKNKFERRILDQLEGSGLPVKYEGERIAYVYSGHYTPDFVLTTPTGKVYLETKGYFRPEHKRVMRAAKKTNPNLDIRIIFYAPNKKYERWAIKNGFRYAFKEVPQEWIDGY